MIIIVGHATQEDIVLTPQSEPGVDFITVQLRDDEGQPISDVHFIPVTGADGDLYLMPLLVAGMRETLPELIKHFQNAIRFAGLRKGVFDERKFIDAVYLENHKPAVPLPSPVIPQPAPIVTGGISISEAQVVIEAYARSRGGALGSALGDVFVFPQAVGSGYARNYSRGRETNGISIVVCSIVNGKPVAFLVKNDFFINYTGDNFSNRARLGAPIEDERSVSGGAEQKFQKGRMNWTPTGGVKVTLNP